MTADGNSFTESTIGYWQELADDIPSRFSPTPPYRYGYPVRLPCNRVLVLPLRRLPDGLHAVASLIANQASYSVVTSLSEHMAFQARQLGAELIVGLPTLGLSFASLVAEKIGQSRYAPLGYSRKFWYDEALSEPVHSITSPEPGKQLRLDPNLLPILKGRRIVIVDDTISTGASMLAATRLLGNLGVAIAGLVVAMKQTNRWQSPIQSLAISPPVRAVFGCPLFRFRMNGWWPEVDTQPEIP